MYLGFIHVAPRRKSRKSKNANFSLSVLSRIVPKKSSLRKSRTLKPTPKDANSGMWYHWQPYEEVIHRCLGGATSPGKVNFYSTTSGWVTQQHNQVPAMVNCPVKQPAGLSWQGGFVPPTLLCLTIALHPESAQLPWSDLQLKALGVRKERVTPNFLPPDLKHNKPQACQAAVEGS